MFLNQSNINSIIHDLNRSIGLHSASIDEEECFAKDVGQSNCHHCNLEDIIQDLECLKSHLLPFGKQTNSLVQFIDAEAFRFALSNLGQFNKVLCIPIFNDPNSELNYESPKDADGFIIQATIERFAMDGVGFHVGYESVTYQWNCIDKHELGIVGIPYILSKYVVNPNQFEIVDTDCPEPEEPIHDDDCELNSEPDGECDCGAIEGLYYPPDDDFWYQQLDGILDSIEYPDAEFNLNNRMWSLGELTYDMNRFQDDVYYQNQLNENDGAPLIG